MSKPEFEIPLSGGNVNPTVVRINDTVRRSLTKHSTSVHQLLVHLQAKEYDFAPRFLGIDDKGREIISFIPGSSDIPADIWQNEAALRQAATMLRAYHDATVDMDIADLEWAYSNPDSSTHEVICHNDFALYNMVFSSGLPVGIVDFDLAGPGPRLRDLAYLAYWVVPLSFQTQDMMHHSIAQLERGNERLKMLCSTYGIRDSEKLVHMVSEVLHHMGNEKSVGQMIGTEAARRLAAAGHMTHWQTEAAAFDARKPEILAQMDCANVNWSAHTVGDS